jgi:hypothetical protein
VEDACDSPERRELEPRALQLRRRQEEARNATWDGDKENAASRGPTSQEDSPDEREEPDLHTTRRNELDKLDAIEQVLLGDLQGIRPVVVRGRVVVDPGTGQQLIERYVRLPVVDRLLRVAERRAKVLGIDAPRRREVAVVTSDMVEELISKIDAEVDRLKEDLGANGLS